MNLATFLRMVLSQTGYGDPQDTDYENSAAAQNVMDSLRERSYELWTANPWDWNVAEISKSVAAGVDDVTLDGASGNVKQNKDIIALAVQGYPDFLGRISFLHYYDWKRANNASGEIQRGIPKHYLFMGYDSSGYPKIRLVRPPSDAITLEGFTRPEITVYTTADIAGNTRIAYFPDHAQRILLKGVKSDIHAILKEKEESNRLDKEFKGEIEFLVSKDQKNKPDRRMRTPVPSWLLRRMRGRANGGSVAM